MDLGPTGYRITAENGPEFTGVFGGPPVSYVGLAKAAGPVDRSVRMVSAGAAHSLTLTSDGVVYAAGESADGERSAHPNLPPSSLVYDPNVVYPIPPMKSVAAGASVSAAVSTIGDLWMWGRNSGWQYPDGSAGTAARRVEVSVSVGALVDVSLGLGHGLVVTGNGQVWTWGANDCGQRGDGTTAAIAAASEVVFPLGVRIVRAETTVKSNVALDDKGGVWQWGCGFGSTATKVTGVANAVQVAAGDGSGYAVSGNGLAYGWGRNEQGQLGDGTTVFRVDARPVLTATGDPLRDVRSVTAGGLRVEAITASGALVLGASVQQSSLQSAPEFTFAQTTLPSQFTDPCCPGPTLGAAPFDWDLSQFLEVRLPFRTGFAYPHCLSSAGVPRGGDVEAPIDGPVRVDPCDLVRGWERDLALSRNISLTADATQNLRAVQVGRDVAIRRFGDAVGSDGSAKQGCLTAAKTALRVTTLPAGVENLRWMECGTRLFAPAQQFTLSGPLDTPPNETFGDRVADPGSPSVAATGKIFGFDVRENSPGVWGLLAKPDGVKTTSCTGTVVRYPRRDSDGVLRTRHLLATARHCFGEGWSSYLFVPGMTDASSASALALRAPYGAFAFDLPRVTQDSTPVPSPNDYRAIAHDFALATLYPQATTSGPTFTLDQMADLFVRSKNALTNPSPKWIGQLPLVFPRVDLSKQPVTADLLRSTTTALGYPQSGFNGVVMVATQTDPRVSRASDGSKYAEHVSIQGAGASGGPLLQNGFVRAVRSKGDGYTAGGTQSTFCLLGPQFVGLFDQAITKELTL